MGGDTEAKNKNKNKQITSNEQNQINGLLKENKLKQQQLQYCSQHISSENLYYQIQPTQLGMILQNGIW